MILQYTYNNKKFSLSPNNTYKHESENLFTIIIGKNGTGKSRLLQSIINDLNEIKETYEIVNSDNIFFNKEPTNIIAVSISPFDKFPLHNKFLNEIKDYNYLGIRDLYAGNIGKSYMSKITFSLLK